MKITAMFLRQHGAACSQLKTFEKEWPDGGELTRVNILRAAKLGLDLDWFATHCLSPSARAAFGEASDSAWATFDEATASAWATRQKAKAKASAVYPKARARAWAAFGEARAKALIEIVAGKHGLPAKAN